MKKKRIFILFLAFLLFFTTNVYALEQDDTLIDDNPVMDTGDALNTQSESEPKQEDGIKKDGLDKADNSDTSLSDESNDLLEQVPDNDLKEEGAFQSTDDSLDKKDDQETLKKEGSTNDVGTSKEDEEGEIPNTKSSEPTEQDASKGNSFASDNNEGSKDTNENGGTETPTLRGDADTPTTQDNTESPSTTDHVQGDVSEVQKVKVVISKVLRDGEVTTPLEGAELQIIRIIDEAHQEVVYSWVSSGEEETIYLPDGKYIIHEVKPPEGYTAAKDIEFTVAIKVEEVNAGTDLDPYPCDHYGNGVGHGVVLYYVEINGVKYEVYCINQSLGTPDENSTYDGYILSPDNIKSFSVQETYKNSHLEREKRDVSDPSLDGKALYDKYLDIIYHRHLAIKQFPDLNETEIRYVTENALKNYSDATLMERQKIKKELAPKGYDKVSSHEVVENGITYVWYIYPMYRSFVYLPDAPLGEPIFTTDVGGEGANGFGNLARHWSPGGNGAHNAQNDPDVRAQVARYYELYNFLVSDENPHPKDMNLYIYSSESIHYYTYQGNDYQEAYQDLLGVSGYFETHEQEEQHYEVVNTYSEETTEASIQKVWEDQDNKYETRPDEVTVKLESNYEEINQEDWTISLNEENDWSASISEIPKYYKGNPVEYKWIELSQDKGYVLTNNATEGTLTTITNTLEVVDVTVTKIWNDNNNKYGLRPSSIEVTLSNGMKVTLNEENNWTATINDLPKYKDGEEIIYTWSEPTVNGYTLKDKTVNDNVTTLTNEPVLIDISVEKRWDDNENEKGKRPNTVTITLQAFGEDVTEYEFKSTEGWTHVFKELPKFDKDGNEIEYSVIEKIVPEDYKEYYSGNVIDGFVVYNGLGHGDVTPPPENNPPTGDNIEYHIMTLFVSVILLISSKIYLKRYE